MKCASATQVKNQRSFKTTFQRSLDCTVGAFASASLRLLSNIADLIEVVAQLKKKEMIAVRGILISD
jgi:hypothetical protein